MTSEALITRIAALDAAASRRRLAGEEKARYDRERAELKRALTEQRPPTQPGGEAHGGTTGQRPRPPTP